MKYASIDIGTNTALLLVADLVEGRIIPLMEKERFSRLGQGVDAGGYVSDTAVERVAEALNDFRSTVNEHFPSVHNVVVTATSAARDASNRSDFLERIKKLTGLEIRILSGLEEAEWTYLGALSMIGMKKRPYTVIDIGGGSTEIAAGVAGSLADHHSFDIGSVRFTERYLNQQPPKEKDIQLCRRAIRENIRDKHLQLDREADLVGVAGTVLTLACLESGYGKEDWQLLDGYQLTLRTVEQWIDRMKNLNSVQILELGPEILKGRSDLILAGLLILQECMSAFGYDKLQASTGGIRHGAILKTAQK